ncbi:MAG TPA: flagellar hook-associated protein FlgL [Acidothermaceae bacterium]|jgi:flagellar hook-associated protein 3 FlgL
MRVTQNAVTTAMLAGLQANKAELSRLQLQLSSGRQVTKPSDDPVGTDQAMQYRTEIARANQYQRNGNDGLAWLGTADGALQSGVAILNRLRVLTTQAANTGASDANARTAIAAEVDSLKSDMLGLANTTYLGRPIFGGATSLNAAYVKDPATGLVSYQGDTGKVTRTVGSNAVVQVNINAADAFGSPGNDIFTTFDQILNDLKTNPTNLTNDLVGIQASLDRMTNAQSIEGAAYNRINNMINLAGAHADTLTGNLSDVENVDTAKAATELTMQQVSYQASLAAMSKVLQLSLTDFLR